MNVSEFDFELPENLITQNPIVNRSDSKMMIINRVTGEIEHKRFSDVIDYFNKGDVLVLNNTKVIPARIYGFTNDSNGKIEFLIIKNIKDDIWEVMCKPGKKAKVGKVFNFGNGRLYAKVLEVLDNGNRYVEFKYKGCIYDILDEIGEMPIPPYIKESLKENARYQTVYSKEIGSIASPTAGLHFTEKLIRDIMEKGIKIVYVTLHVGLGTFLPIKVNDIEKHEMHEEYYSINEISANIINEAKANGKRIIAVGTTSMRTLESVALINDNGFLCADSGYTKIFIKPGYDFKVVDSLITNFHLPKSTLLILVSAFYDRDKILSCYNNAIENEYKFFSFGDSMFLI